MNTEMCCHIKNVKTLHRPAKQNVVSFFFFYSLFVKSMYITVNKATFMVAEINNPIIRNSKKFNINATSLSHS